MKTNFFLLLFILGMTAYRAEAHHFGGRCYGRGYYNPRPVVVYQQPLLPPVYYQAAPPVCVQPEPMWIAPHYVINRWGQRIWVRGRWGY